MEKPNMDLIDKTSLTPDFVPKGSSALKSVRGDNLKLIQDDDFDSIFDTDNSLSGVEIDDEYATILFPENALDDIERFLTTVDDAIILIDDALYRFLFVAKKEEIDAYMEKYQIPEHIAKGRFSRMIKCSLPARTMEVVKRVRKDRPYVLSYFSLRDRINLLYYLCSGDLMDGKIYEYQKNFDKVIQRFMFKQLAEIENLPDDKSKEQAVIKMSQRFFVSPSILRARINQFTKEPGKLKKLYYEVVLSDGSRANLFDLDPTKTHKIMGTVVVDEINQERDFSNLIIHGCFGCKNAKAPIILPRYIQGDLDLFGYKFKNITRIPDGVKIVDLSYFVKSFTDLNKMEFPNTILEVRVARSVINNALKNPEELKQVRDFIDKYSTKDKTVEVWDTKYRVSLNDMLFKEKEENKPQKQEKTVKKPEVQKNKIMQKTDDWLTREEIVDILSQDERFVDIDGWDRLIKRVVKHGVSITEYRLFNNQSVLCVHKDNIEKVARTLLQIIQEDLARTEKKAQQQNAEIKTEGSKQKPIKLKNNKQSKVVHIEKYIQRSAWKGICSSCNDGTNLLQSMLESVSKINTDFTKQKHGDPVQYIDENGKECSLADIRVKSGKAAAQRLGVSGKDNKRRVIWTYNPEDNIMVAIDFFVSHGKGKLEDTYNKIAIPNAAKGYLMDGKTFVDKNLVKSGDFLKVSDLLDDIKSDKTDNYAEQEELLEPAQDQQEIEVVQDDENVVVGNQDLIAETPVISQEKEPKQPQAPVQNLDVNKEANHYRPRRCYSLVDVKLEEARIQSLIKSLDEEIRRLSREMCHQQNPNEQLKIANNIKELIKQKIRCIGK